MTKKHDELVEEVGKLICPTCHWYSAGDNKCVGYTLQEAQGRCANLKKVVPNLITLILSAVRDGKVKVKCPGCDEAIELLKCTGCHLENLEGYIV